VSKPSLQVPGQRKSIGRFVVVISAALPREATEFQGDPAQYPVLARIDPQAIARPTDVDVDLLGFRISYPAERKFGVPCGARTVIHGHEVTIRIGEPDHWLAREFKDLCDAGFGQELSGAMRTGLVSRSALAS
jgi:hypothetical protein